MITNAIIIVVVEVLTLACSGLSLLAAPLEIVSGFVEAMAWVAWANYYIPLNVFVVCSLAVMALWIPAGLIRAFFDLL